MYKLSARADDTLLGAILICTYKKNESGTGMLLVASFAAKSKDKLVIVLARLK